MSLTSFIKQTEVRKKFREQFPKPRFNIKKEPLFPPLTKNYMEVGAAFDYLFRFGLKRNNPKAAERRGVAELALRDMPGFTSDSVTGKSYFEPELIGDYVRYSYPELFDSVRLINKNIDRIKSIFEKVYRNSERADRIIREAKSRYSRFLKSGRLTKHLIKSAILLARLEGIFKGGISIVAPEQIDLDTINEKDITDLRNLIKAVNWHNFKARQICLLNPTFGEASRLVGGADADVVIDDTLIEIKTTIKWDFKRDYFSQLIGYYCLYCIGGIDGLPKKRKIKNFAIYFSRQAYLHVLPLNQCIDNQRFTEFFEWFKDKVENYAKR